MTKKKIDLFNLIRKVSLGIDHTDPFIQEKISDVLHSMKDKNEHKEKFMCAVYNTPIVQLEVKGNSMAPVILEEDILHVDTDQEPRANGHDIAVFDIEGTYHVCRYTRYGQQLIMIHDNAPLLVVHEDKARLVGKVVQVDFEPINTEKEKVLAAWNDKNFIA